MSRLWSVGARSLICGVLEVYRRVAQTKKQDYTAGTTQDCNKVRYDNLVSFEPDGCAHFRFESM